MTTRRTFLGAVLPAALRAAPVQFDRERIANIFDELRNDERRDLRGVRIVTEGNLVAEAYFNGGGAEVLHDIRSAGKSITSLLAGIAIDQGRIPDVQVPISRLLGSRAQAVTLEHLLTMRSGLAADDGDPKSPGNENRMDEAASWMDFALAVPVREKPGQRYLYCSLNAFLAGACVENACKQPLDAFARRYLFGPLGIDRFEWRKGPQNRVAGQGNLRINLAGMSALGQLCLNRGRAGSAQLVSERWIERSLSPIVPISDVDPFADSYGYMWYTKDLDVAGRRIRVHFASGNGGNKIYIIPEVRTVIAIASAAYGRPYGQRRSQQILKDILQSCRAQ